MPDRLRRVLYSIVCNRNLKVLGAHTVATATAHR